jgi:hypothetical protein
VTAVPADQPTQTAAAPRSAPDVELAVAKPNELPTTRPAQVAAEPAAQTGPPAPVTLAQPSSAQQAAVAQPAPLPAPRPAAPPAPMTKPPVSRDVLLAMKPASGSAPAPTAPPPPSAEQPTQPAPATQPAPPPPRAVATPTPQPATAPVVASASEPPADVAPEPPATAVALKTYNDNAGAFAVSVPETWRPGNAPPTRVAIVLTGPSAVPDRKAPPIFRAQVGQQPPAHARRGVDEFARDLIQQVTKRSPESSRTRIEPARIDGVEARQFMLTLEDSRGMDIDMKYVVAIKPPVSFIFTYLQERGLFDEAEADAIFSSIRWTSSDGRARPAGDRPVERSSAR